MGSYFDRQHKKPFWWINGRNIIREDKLRHWFKTNQISTQVLMLSTLHSALLPQHLGILLHSTINISARVAKHQSSLSHRDVICVVVLLVVHLVQKHTKLEGVKLVSFTKVFIGSNVKLILEFFYMLTSFTPTHFCCTFTKITKYKMIPDSILVEKRCSPELLIKSINIVWFIGWIK